MNILLVFVFVLFLLYISLVLLASTITQRITLMVDKEGNIKYRKINAFFSKLQQENIRTSSGYIAFLIALWNFFAPDFGSLYGGVTLIGALVPSTVLLLDSFILSPGLHEKLPIPQNYQTKLDQIIIKITPFSGWLTLIVACVHAVAYRVPFL